MKRVITLFIAIVAVCACNSALAAKIYYVVAGSYNSVESAQNSNIEGDIFEAQVNGKTVYRICPNSFYSLSDAKEYAQGMKNELQIDAWVCPNEGKLKHVDCMGQTCTCHPSKGIHSTATVYYIVADSYNSLEEAKTYNVNCPDGMEGSIMLDQAKGKQVYRACIAVYSSKAAAQKSANLYNNMYVRKYWVWPHKGPAKCVHFGCSLRGTLIYLNATSGK